MRKTILTTILSNRKSIVTIGVPFIAGLPFRLVSRQVWILSLILTGVIFLMTMISSYLNNKKITCRGVFTGQDSPLLKGAISFCLGTTLATLFVLGINSFNESKREYNNQLLFEQYFSDMGNIVLAYNYFQEKSIAPSLDVIIRLNCPPRLQKATLGFCEYKNGNYQQAREAFESDLYHNPISSCYLGLILYLGLGDLPYPEKGLEHIQKAADAQVHEAQVFLFSLALKNGNGKMAESLAKSILYKKPTTAKIYSTELLAVTNRSVVHPFYISGIDVLYLMNDYYIHNGKFERAVELMERYFSGFSQDEDLEAVQATLTMNYLYASGNAHHINRAIRQGVKKNNPVYLNQAAEKILFDKDGNLRDATAIRNKDLIKAEQYLKIAASKRNLNSAYDLAYLYNSRGDSLAAIETMHMYSLAKMMSDATR